MRNPQEKNAPESGTADVTSAKPLGLLHALLIHSLLFMVFRHDGYGLPRTRSPMLYVLGACYIFTGAAMTALALSQGVPGVGSVHTEVLFKIAVATLICIILQPPVASSYFLAATTSQFLAGAAYAAVQPLPDWLLPGLSVWMGVAYIKLLFAYGKRLARARKEKSSGK